MCDDWEQRIGKVLGVKEDEDEDEDEDDEFNLPMVSFETLKKYLEYLRKELVFPLQAVHENETGPFESAAVKVTITQLAEEIDENYGLLCEGKEGKRHVVMPLAELSVKETDPNFVFIDDYLTWFWNYR
ncbi:calcium-binding protein [Paenibacillus sp. BR2-3]|uniref:calcium-binding protein n=1 Tax=Paenibacillus sp. BR2-3 TaxID=3048494 RepID=UPI003977370C